MHGGFVGMGMLDAACPGAVFTSPVPDQMLAATKAVNGGAGVLHIVKNYTGDIMNFEIAAEMAQAEGIEVTSVVIADDVAVQDSLYTAGRRGVGGTVLAEKIVGAAAEAGADLKTVTALCQKVQDNVRSMGMALTSCTVPAAGKPTFDISDSEMEIGVGIHGEPGPPAPAAQAGRRDRRDDDGPRSSMRASSTRGDSVLAFVNGMGGTPLIELYIVYRKVAEILAGKGVTIARNLIGPLHHVARDGRDVDHAPQARRRADPPAGTRRSIPRPSAGESDLVTTTGDLTRFLEIFAARIHDARDELTQLDSAIGDADHGINMDRGMTAVLDDPSEPPGRRSRDADEADRHEAHLHGRRRERPAVRDVLPPPWYRVRRGVRAGAGRPRSRLSGRPGGRRRPGQGRTSATRRWSTR